jgi:hypothetical protein
MDRTGHTTSGMLQRYRCAARSAAELGLGSLAPLDQAIPEFRKVDQRTWAKRAGVAKHRKKFTPEKLMLPTRCTRGGSNSHALRRRNLNPVRLPIPPLVLVIWALFPALFVASASSGIASSPAAYRPGPAPQQSGLPAGILASMTLDSWPVRSVTQVSVRPSANASVQNVACPTGHGYLRPFG